MGRGEGDDVDFTPVECFGSCHHKRRARAEDRKLTIEELEYVHTLLSMDYVMCLCSLLCIAIYC